MKKILGLFSPWNELLLRLLQQIFENRDQRLISGLPFGNCTHDRTNRMTSFLDESAFVGELALDGALHPINGILSYCVGRWAFGSEESFCSHRICSWSITSGKCSECMSLIFESLSILENPSGETIRPVEPEMFSDTVDTEESFVDFSSVRGQEHAKRALEIALPQGHITYLWMVLQEREKLMARAFRGILPNLEREEALEVARIYSVAEFFLPKNHFPKNARFALCIIPGSAVSIVGGGSKIKPGEISLAHRGVLFLDELPEFPLRF